MTSTGGRPGTPPRSGNVQGVLFMLAAVTLLTSMFGVTKQLTTSGLPVLEVAMFRMSVAWLFYLPWFIRDGRAALATERLPAHFCRAFFGATSLLCMVYAVDRLLLADAMVLGFTFPLWTILLSAVFLGEKVRLRRSLATVIGFIGVVVVVRPQAGVDPAMLVALLAAVLITAAIITMKKLTMTEPPNRIIFYFFTIATLLLLPPAVVVWQTPSAAQWAWLAALGFVGSFGQYWLTRAYQAGEVTIIAPMDFLRLPLAALIGYLVFREVPDLWGFVGAAIIIATCVYIVRREAMLKKDHVALE